MSAASRVRRAYLGGLCLLAAIAALCFARVAEFGFAYDDHWTIVDNQALDRPLRPLLRAVFSGSPETRAIPDSTRPTMVVSAWIDRRMFGRHATGPHLHSLALYALTSALSGLVMLRLSRSVTIAVIGGALFAVAPVHAEVVSAINYREDLLAAVGVLVVLAWLFRPHWREESLDAVTLVTAVFGIALLAKESAVGVVPIALGLYAVRRPDSSFVRNRARTLVALGCLLLLWAAWRIGLRVSGVDDVPLAERAGFPATVLATARYETRAVAAVLLPFAWSPEYAPEKPASIWWLLPALGLVIATFALARHRATRLPAMGLAIALLAPLSTSPLIGPANERADRFVFLGVLGGGLIWGYLGDIVVRRFALPARLRPLLLAGLLAPCVLVSQTAALAWKSDFSLWMAATERAPDSYRAWTGLSRALRLEGRLTEADQAVERAIELNPSSRSAHVTRAYNRLARGDLAGARRDILRVRELGGERQKGLRRAERCAALDPDKARTCILAGSPHP